MHTTLRTLRVLYRDRFGDLYGIPYLMRDNETPASILPKVRTGYGERWVALSGSGGAVERTAHQQREVAVYLRLFRDFVPGAPGEWSVLPPIELVDSVLGKGEPVELRPGHAEGFMATATDHLGRTIATWVGTSIRGLMASVDREKPFSRTSGVMVRGEYTSDGTWHKNYGGRMVASREARNPGRDGWHVE